jgi:A/G-specific adenine glycosylase
MRRKISRARSSAEEVGASTRKKIFDAARRASNPVQGAKKNATSDERASNSRARAATSRTLLAWYRANRRALPWRDRPIPYAVLVSEVMLQQTRVETVIPYYQRFMAAFPDEVTLARAPIDEVLALWSGLGYYSRARRLHAAAQAVVARGGFPRTEEELIELPGIGAYTAAAVASIAFGERVAVVDGNVERVVARLLALDVDPAKSAARRLVRETAASLLEDDAPGDSNQALMELGATICLPRAPRCLVCPLTDHCEARASGRAEELPVRAPRRAAVEERRVVAAARRGDRFLLVRNPDASELLAGMWEFPWTAKAPRRQDEEEALARSYGGEWRIGAVRGKARHGITFRSLELEVRDAEVRLDADEVAERGDDSRAEARWLSRAEIAAVPTTSMVRKVLACFEDES